MFYSTIVVSTYSCSHLHHAYITQVSHSQNSISTNINFLHECILLSPHSFSYFPVFRFSGIHASCMPLLHVHIVSLDIWTLPPFHTFHNLYYFFSRCRSFLPHTDNLTLPILPLVLHSHFYTVPDVLTQPLLLLGREHQTPCCHLSWYCVMSALITYSRDKLLTKKTSSTPTVTVFEIILILAIEIQS